MRTYKETDKRSNDIIEMLDFYYDADHPIESLVSTEKIDELITILREEYGIFYAPKETHFDQSMDILEEDYCIHNCHKCQYFHIVESFCELFDDEDYLNYL
jgi:hypothetical protein